MPSTVRIDLCTIHFYYPCYHLNAGYLHLYTGETNHVSRVHSVAAVLFLQLKLHVMLFFSRENSFVLLR